MSENEFYEALSQALDAHPAAAALAKGKAVKGKAPKAAGLFGGFGTAVTTVLKGLQLSGVPWAIILSKLLPIVIEDVGAGKSVTDVLTDILKRYLGGEF